jgi:DNA-binding HxlR family transcriptional regulator
VDDAHRSDAAPFRRQVCGRYARAADLLGKRWSVTVVAVLADGTSRFNGIRHAVPGISPKLLSERLRELEAAGVVERRVLPTTPVSIEYVLTAKGRALRDVVDALQHWADDWVEERPDARPPGGRARPVR